MINSVEFESDEEVDLFMAVSQVEENGHNSSSDETVCYEIDDVHSSPQASCQENCHIENDSDLELTCASPQISRHPYCSNSNSTADHKENNRPDADEDLTQVSFVSTDAEDETTQVSRDEISNVVSLKASIPLTEDHDLFSTRESMIVASQSLISENTQSSEPYKHQLESRVAETIDEPEKNDDWLSTDYSMSLVSSQSLLTEKSDLNSQQTCASVLNKNHSVLPINLKSVEKQTKQNTDSSISKQDQSPLKTGVDLRTSSPPTSPNLLMPSSQDSQLDQLTQFEPLSLEMPSTQDFYAQLVKRKIDLTDDEHSGNEQVVNDPVRLGNLEEDILTQAESQKTKEGLKNCIEAHSPQTLMNSSMDSIFQEDTQVNNSFEDNIFYKETQVPAAPKGGFLSPTQRPKKTKRPILSPLCPSPEEKIDSIFLQDTQTFLSPSQKPPWARKRAGFESPSQALRLSKKAAVSQALNENSRTPKSMSFNESIFLEETQVYRDENDSTASNSLTCHSSDSIFSLCTQVGSQSSNNGAGEDIDYLAETQIPQRNTVKSYPEEKECAEDNEQTQNDSIFYEATQLPVLENRTLENDEPRLLTPNKLNSDPVSSEIESDPEIEDFMVSLEVKQNEALKKRKSQADPISSEIESDSEVDNFIASLPSEPVTKSLDVELEDQSTSQNSVKAIDKFNDCVSSDTEVNEFVASNQDEECKDTDEVFESQSKYKKIPESPDRQDEILTQVSFSQCPFNGPASPPIDFGPPSQNYELPSTPPVLRASSPRLSLEILDTNYPILNDSVVSVSLAAEQPEKVSVDSSDIATVLNDSVVSVSLAAAEPEKVSVNGSDIASVTKSSIENVMSPNAVTDHVVTVDLRDSTLNSEKCPADSFSALKGNCTFGVTDSSMDDDDAAYLAETQVDQTSDGQENSSTDSFDLPCTQEFDRQLEEAEKLAKPKESCSNTVECNKKRPKRNIKPTWKRRESIESPKRNDRKRPKSLADPSVSDNASCRRLTRNLNKTNPMTNTVSSRRSSASSTSTETNLKRKRKRWVRVLWSDTEDETSTVSSPSSNEPNKDSTRRVTRSFYKANLSVSEGIEVGSPGISSRNALRKSTGRQTRDLWPDVEDENDAIDVCLQELQVLLRDSCLQPPPGQTLKDCLKAAMKEKILADYTVYSSESVVPDPNIVSKMVRILGGKCLQNKPKTWPRKSLLISCLTDAHVWPPITYRHVKIVNLKILLHGVVHRTLPIKDYLIR